MVVVMGAVLVVAVVMAMMGPGVSVVVGLWYRQPCWPCYSSASSPSGPLPCARPLDTASSRVAVQLSDCITVHPAHLYFR